MLLHAALGITLLAPHAQAQTSRTRVAAPVPPWQQRLMPWLSYANEPRPWRTDKRFTGRFARGLPDDVQVLFTVPAGGQSEVVWVTITAYDAASDQFLAIASNRRSGTKLISPYDNVVFRFREGAPYPVAIDRGAGYGRAGWPTSRAPTFFNGLLAGIRAYRAGHNGRNIPSIRQCATILEPLAKKIPPEARTDERFVLHYVLGRCYAELLDTKNAITAFRAALSDDPNDPHTHMALIAEYSIMVHLPDDKLPAKERALWDQAIINEIDFVRKHYMSYPGVSMALNLMFDAKAADANQWPAADRARGARIGYSRIRWKQR